jgi:hypothetical protein
MKFAFWVLSWRFTFRVILGRTTPVVAAPPPRPINTRITRLPGKDGSTQTCIARTWRLADAQRCRLCPDRCHASQSTDTKTAMCLMVAQGDVSLADAKLFSPARVIAVAAIC